MKSLILFLASLCLLISNTVQARTADKVAAIVPPGELSIREIRYDGKLADGEARFAVTIDAECTGKEGASLPLFDGDVAVLPSKLPADLQIVREGNWYMLRAARAGKFSFKLEVVAKIERAEPWNQISFNGPPAAIASVAAQAGGAGMEVQLLSGTLVESAQTNGVSRVRGLLGADRTVTLRWQGKVTEVARKTLITADTTVSAQITPTVIKYTTQIRYDIVQGNAPRLSLALPAAHALTRLVGEQIRDWHITTSPLTEGSGVGSDRQILTIEFIKPVEKSYSLTLFSEQPVESTAAVRLDPPQPLEIERESGSFTVSAEDMLAETDSLAGLRQINATGGALAAYRFNARPFTLALRLKRIESVVSVNDRVTARLEETRLLISHSLALNVEKAGVYMLELTPQPGLVVADVRGDGVEDWKVSDGKLKVNFSARVLGSRKLDVQLEQALKVFPDRIAVAPLRVAGASKETTQIGASSAAGIRLKSGELAGLREIPVNRLQNRADELLAYTADQPDWQLSLASERLAPRIVADVFNLVTVGDGLVGGSATIRYGILNQGVQEFKVKLPAHCKNVEFTGPNIRRKEALGDIWTIGLQDKAWGGYTLVVTYDYQFDSKSATLPIAGIHTVDVERETGSIAVTTAASLKLNPKTATDLLRRVDETELAAGDRALVTRAVVLAYQYTGGDYDLSVEVQRHPQLDVLDAVADRTQITSVLNEAGEMLTQASFMVKNNEKQFQKFKLPKGADFWGCYVNGQPAKPGREGDWVLVPLPRGANRDQAFAVDIVYAQTNSVSKSGWRRPLALAAPQTDVPNTYAEWELYVPKSQRLSDFGGSMSVAQGTTYGVLDAWQKFLTFYLQVLREAGGAILVVGILAFLVIALVVSAARRGMSGVLTLLGVIAILAVLGAMLLPALAKAKARAMRTQTINNLKQVGLAARQFALDNNDRLPVSFEEMMNELNTDKITYDVESGQRFIYLGAGLPLDSLTPDSVIAYSVMVNNHCNVVLADGSVQSFSAQRFGELANRGLIQYAKPEEIARAEQERAVARGQLQRPTPQRAGAVTATAEAPPAGVHTVIGTGFTGGAGGGGALGAVPAAAPPPAAVKGLRSIRIEIPREGNSFLFTKILNVGDEALSVSARMTRLQTFQTWQMLGQLAAFLAGLIAWWWQWRRERPNTFILTCAASLVIVSVGSLLIAWRALHDALIIGFPVVVVAFVAWLAWKYFSKHRSSQVERAPDMPPSIAAIALLLSLGITSAQAADEGIRAPAAVSILSAAYTGTVNDRVAQLDAVLQLSAAKPDQTVALFGDDVAIQQFSVKSGDAKLVRDGNTVSVRLGKSGNATLLLKLVVKIGGDVTKRHLAFNIPAALSSQVSLALDQPEADVVFPSAISFKRATDKDRTRVEAIIGSGARVELLWTPRVKRAAEVAATVFCQNSSLVTVGGGVVNCRAVLDYQVTQGELRQVRVQLPAGQRLLRVEGDSIRTWEIREEKASVSTNQPTPSPSQEGSNTAGARRQFPSWEGSGVGGGGQTLVVELLKGVSPSYRLTVETEKALDALPASVGIETPHALDVKRETGLVALRGAEELTLSVESAKELQRVESEEFGRTIASKTEGLTSVFRFLKPEFELRARVETVQAQVEAIVRNAVRVAGDQVAISAVIDYTIKRAGVFSLRVALPANYRVQTVTGEKVAQWIEREENGARALEVALKERTSGAYTLRIELMTTFKELPKSLAIAGVHPLDASKLTGFVSVTADAGVSVKTETFDGLTEIPATALPDAGLPRRSAAETGGALAYKFIATESQAAQPWKLSVATEAVEPWLRAEAVQTFTLTDTLVSGRAQMRFDIANAPVKELRLRIPAEFKNVEISGANIRRRDQQGDLWLVELQNKTRGNYTLTVTWERARASKTNQVELAGISAEGVERETGLITIAAKPPLQVTESSAADLTRVDAREFPDWAGKADDATVQAYRYVRPGYKLVVEVRRFDEAQVLQALLDSAHFTTVVADDGQVMTEMALSVRNNGRQFLEVELPAGMKVWSAFIAGQPVRPSHRDGKLLLPLQEWGADDEAVSVELTYVGTNLFPKVRGTVNFISPKFDVPLKNAQWELYLPQHYDYDDFAGTMTREKTVLPTLLSFGASEYSRMEWQNKAAYKEEAKKDVTKAQSNLSSGNVKEAVSGYYRAKGRSLAGENERDADVESLRKQLRNVQGNNLIQAQQAFSVANAGVPADQPMQFVPGNMEVNFNDAAEAQWEKLAQAQEIAAAKVQPLHVNLPLRGLRYAFNQVLQTEVNKPMTIQMSAANTKIGNWLVRIGGLVGSFIALWIAVAFVSARKHA